MQTGARGGALIAMAAGVMVLFLSSTTKNAGPSVDLHRRFEKRDVMIPMRDGVRLHTAIYTPRIIREPLPILLLRSPYGIRDQCDGFTILFSEYPLYELVAEGYIFVFQDIRGRFQSEGRFVMVRPPRDPSDPKAMDENSDAYDTIEWLLKNIPRHNGRVDVYGDSYDAWLAVMAMLEPHQALKAISEAATNADMFIGDDFCHNGAFRLSMCFTYIAAMETSNVVAPFKFDRYYRYEWYLGLGLLSNANRNYFGGRCPTWNDFVAHSAYDRYWQRQQLPRYLQKVTVPILHVAGWWDHEDFYGPVKAYETLERNDTRQMNYLVAGQRNHDGWLEPTGRTLGQIDFESDTSRCFRETAQAPWFAFWLKDTGRLSLPEALTFQTGTNQWESHDSWPPRKGFAERRLYFRSSGTLSFTTPHDEGAEACDSYDSDPDCPVPYVPRPITGASWPTWLVQDQRFAHLPPDVLSWETAPLFDHLTVAGNIVAHLFASTSGTDSDCAVKLIDVYPEDYAKDPKVCGYQLMIAAEIFRAKFHKSFERPEPVVPNVVVEYPIDLHTNNHCFQKGHRIMVQVQSTWFPAYDRNPQTYVGNIFEAPESDYRKASRRIFRSVRFPSHIRLPVKSR